jgi:hypothetical protein
VTSDQLDGVGMCVDVHVYCPVCLGREKVMTR